MFHVKPVHGRPLPADRTTHFMSRPQCLLPGLVMSIVVDMALFMAASSAQAAIHKCTGADGKVAFSDQPCVGGQTAATVKPAAVAPILPIPPPPPVSPDGNNAPAGTPAKDPDAAARAAARERIRAGQTPQCLTLGDRVTSLVDSGARGVSPAEVKATVDRYEQQCAAQVRAAIAAENSRNEALQKQLMVDLECKEKRRVLSERRPRLASLSSEDRKAFSAVEADVARVCR